MAEHQSHPKSRKHIVYNALIGPVLLTIFYIGVTSLDPFGSISKSEDLTRNFLQRLQAPFYEWRSHDFHERIVVVTVSDHDIEAGKLEPKTNMSPHSPVHRGEYGRIAEWAAFSNPTAIFIDLLFPEEGDGAGTDELAEILDAHDEGPHNVPRVPVFLADAPAEGHVAPQLRRATQLRVNVATGTGQGHVYTLLSSESVPGAAPLNVRTTTHGSAGGHGGSVSPAYAMFAAFIRSGCPGPDGQPMTDLPYDCDAETLRRIEQRARDWFGNPRDLNMLLTWGSTIPDTLRGIYDPSPCRGQGGPWLERTLSAIDLVWRGLTRGWKGTKVDRACTSHLQLRVDEYITLFSKDRLPDLVRNNFVIVARADYDSADVVRPPIHGRMPAAHMHATALNNLLAFGPAITTASPVLHGELRASDAIELGFVFLVALIADLHAPRPQSARPWWSRAFDRRRVRLTLYLALALSLGCILQWSLYWDPIGTFSMSLFAIFVTFEKVTQTFQAVGFALPQRLIELFRKVTRQRL